MVKSVLYLAFCLVSLVPGSHLELEHSVSVNILVLGRTGSGKSTLINSILGRKIASVGHRPFPETTTVSVYKEKIHGVNVTACDTPGLGDASGKEDDYVRDIKASCSDPDLVIFCLSMDNTRWHNDDTEALITVTEHLGSKIWENSMLVLTFGDRFETNLKDDIGNKFQQRMSDLSGLFTKHLKEIGGLKFRANGKLFSAVSAKGCRHLPGVHDWMTKLMLTCLAATCENGKEGFHQIMIGRTDNPYPDDEEPLVLTNNMWCNLLQKNPVAWTASILGYKAGGSFLAKIVATKLVGAKLGAIIGGPAGFIVGGLGGYTIEYLLSTLTCSNSDKDDDKDDDKDEL